MSIYEVLGLVLLALWWLTTVAYQFEPPILRKINFHGFVPSCRFFAPRPMITDARIYYACEPNRDQPLDQITWQPLIVAPKHSLRPIWNPDQRLEKSVHNIVRQLMRLHESGARVELTIPYLRLLNLANERSCDQVDAGYVRFIITRHRGVEDDGRYITFASHEHRLARA